MFHIPVVYQIELDFLFNIAFCIFSVAINVNHTVVCVYIYTYTYTYVTYFELFLLLSFCQLTTRNTLCFVFWVLESVVFEMVLTF